MLHLSRRALLVFVTMSALFVFVSSAFADDAPPAVPAAGPLPNLMFWAGVLGLLAPVAGYVINYVGPHTSERVKGIVQLVVATAAGTIYELIKVNDFDFDVQHLQVIAAAVFAAFAAHKLFYSPSGINMFFGGGRNLADEKPPKK